MIGPAVRFLVFLLLSPGTEFSLVGPGVRACRLVKDAFVVHRTFTDLRTVSAIRMLCPRIRIEHAPDRYTVLTQSQPAFCELKNCDLAFRDS